MNPQDLPLEPLISPAAISWWPLAPIWWIVLVMIIMMVIIIFTFIIYKKSKTNSKADNTDSLATQTRRTSALKELAKFTKPYNQPAGPWLQQINILLKRISYKQYPHIDTHILLGQDWLNFLNDHCPEAKLAQYPMLVEGVYQDNYYLENNTIDTLYLAIETWINKHV